MHSYSDKLARQTDWTMSRVALLRRGASGIINLVALRRSVVARKLTQNDCVVRAKAPLDALRVAVAVAALSLVVVSGFAQSGKGTSAGRRSVTLNVIARSPEGHQVTKEDFDLYDSGTPQEIESFSRLDSGSRLVLLVDNSANLKAEGAPLQKAMETIINELYQDDQMMVVCFNESAEIIEDMTADLAKLQTAPAKLNRKGFPAASVSPCSLSSLASDRL